MSSQPERRDVSVDHADALPPPFTCSSSAGGLNSAWVRLSGELDLATTNDLAEALRVALLKAPLVVLDLSELSFMDAAGARALVDGSVIARRGTARLIVSRPRDQVVELFSLTQMHDELEIVSVPSDSSSAEAKPGVSQDLPAEPVVNGSGYQPAPWIRPLDNPVNASVHAARVMAVPDHLRRLWLHSADGAVRRAWLPQDNGHAVTPGTQIEVYLDAHDEVNGWRDPASGLAINQRRFVPSEAPAAGSPMFCQGPCGVVWQAPAAEQLVQHDERCLTCAGAITPDRAGAPTQPSA